MGGLTGPVRPSIVEGERDEGAAGIGGSTSVHDPTIVQVILPAEDSGWPLNANASLLTLALRNLSEFEIQV